ERGETEEREEPAPVAAAHGAARACQRHEAPQQDEGIDPGYRDRQVGPAWRRPGGAGETINRGSAEKNREEHRVEEEGGDEPEHPGGRDGRGCAPLRGTGRIAAASRGGRRRGPGRGLALEDGGGRGRHGAPP